MITKAFILGAGLGTRLRPLTDVLPKPLVPVFHVPMANFALRLCQAAGIKEFAIFTTDSHGRVLLQQQPQGNRREGMWHIPRRDHAQTLDLALSLKTTYAITRYHVTLRIYASHSDQTHSQDHETWHPIENLEQLPMPSPDRRALESLISSVG